MTTMQITNLFYDDGHERNDFTIEITTNDVLIPGEAQIEIRDTTYQYARVRFQPAEARELAAALIAAAGEVERGQGEVQDC